MEPRLKKRKGADVLRLGRGPFATQSASSELCRAQRRLSGASVLTTVLPELARWLPVAAAASMCQTCQQWLPALDATRARIADTVARLVSLQGPIIVNVAAGGCEQRRRVGHAITSVELVGPMPAHAEQRRVLATGCLGVAAIEC